MSSAPTSAGIPRKRRPAISLLMVFCLLASSFGCAQLSSGRKYTLAKMDRDGKTLVLPHTVLDPGEKDDLDKIAPNDTVGITLNTAYFRYLDAVDRPEIVIFVRVRIREPDKPESTLVVERVLLNTESREEKIALTKDAFLSRFDIPLFPPIQYNGQDILVSIRVVELDQNDNENVRQLINSAAAAAAVLEPEAAASISVFQTVLTFIANNNADDIEYQLDFALSKSSGPISHTYEATDAKTQKKSKITERYDLVLEPRVGRYAAIKTEHRDRINVPSNYFDLGLDSIRYAAAQVLKIGTLGIFNWHLWEDYGAGTGDDVYLRLLGRPFSVDVESWTLPQYNEQNRLSLTKRVFRPTKSNRVFELQLRDTELALVEPDSWKLPNAPRQTTTFIDQAYTVFSVTSPQTGIPVKTLAEAFKTSKVIENIRTSQLTPEEQKRQIEAITSSVLALSLQDSLSADFSKKVGSAKTGADLEAAWTEFQKKVGIAMEDATPEEESELVALEKKMEAKAEKKSQRLGIKARYLKRFRLEREYQTLKKNTVTMRVIHPGRQEITTAALYSLDPDVHKNVYTTTSIEKQTFDAATYTSIRFNGLGQQIAEATKSGPVLFRLQVELDCSLDGMPVKKSFPVWLIPPISVTKITNEQGKDLKFLEPDGMAVIHGENFGGSGPKKFQRFVTGVNVLDAEGNVQKLTIESMNGESIKVKNPTKMKLSNPPRDKIGLRRLGEVFLQTENPELNPAAQEIGL